MEKKYDVFIIGSGPGGEGAAMTCAKQGKKVAVCDDFSLVGGSNTHKGTIPSKALRHASQVLIDGKGLDGTTYQELLSQTDSVIRRQVELRHGFYVRNDVDLIIGRAALLDAHTVEITEASGLKKKYKAESIIIATGSRPYHPPDVDFSHPRIVDSDKLLKIGDNPKTITIYGAGVIGCEYASIFRGLSIKVNLINTRHQLLSFLDDEIIDALAYHLRENGVLIRHSEEYEKVHCFVSEIISSTPNKSINPPMLNWNNLDSTDGGESQTFYVWRNAPPRKIETPFRQKDIPNKSLSMGADELKLETGLYWWLVKRTGCEGKKWTYSTPKYFIVEKPLMDETPWWVRLILRFK